MKTSFVGHASIIVETKGLRILSDPWWQGPCFGSQWWIYPRPRVDLVEEAPIDFIYVSHGHSDHLHPGTLRRLPKSAKCLVSSTIDIAEPIRRMGFEVWELAPGEVREIGNGVRAEIAPTCNGDTLLVLADGTETVMNLNDALHAAPRAVQDRVMAELRHRYPSIDYVYCGYGLASHFPNCYAIPGKDREATAVRRQRHFNRQWAYIVSRLEPRFGFPFAADVVFLEDELFWSNEPIHNAERPTEVFRAAYPDSATRVYDIAPGFVIEDGRITAERLFEPVSNERIREELRNEASTANSVTKPSREAVEELAARFAQNVDLCRSYLREYKGHYRFLVMIKAADQAIEIAKRSGDVSVSVVDAESADRSHYDVIFTSRYSYIRRALADPHGHEVIFVGSGGIFEYTNPGRVAENLHRELTALLRYRDKPPRSRFGDQPEPIYRVKTALKRLMGAKPETLYDLDAWTVKAS